VLDVLAWLFAAAFIGAPLFLLVDTIVRHYRWRKWFYGE